MLMDPSLKIPCVILPGWKFELLVPSTAVVEILPAQDIDAQFGQSHIIGWLDWREQRIPIIDIDGWDGERNPINQKVIIAVVRLPQDDNRLIALPLQEKPRLLSANQRNIETDFHPPRIHPLAQMYARSQSQSLLLLDWQALANTITSQTS